MLIVLNNKCHFEKENFKKYVKELNKIKTTNELVLCPSNIFLNNIKLNRIFLGSQNVSSYSNGAYTGEVSAKQLKSIGVSYSIVGHSERKDKESLEEINLKIKELLKYNIIPILCIGETKEEKATKKTTKSIKKQIVKALKDIEIPEKVIIAYEPIWAIGTGDIPTEKEIKSIVKYIKKILPNNRLIYGGSVNEDNIDIFNKEEIVDGYLLGGLSLYPKRLKSFFEKIK